MNEIMNWYLYVLKKYAVFKGRARRKEYWYFFLVNIVISVVLSWVDTRLGTPGSAEGAGLLGSVYSLAVLLPSIAVGVRRLHDIDKSGWWMLIGLVPVIGFLVLLYFFVQDSQADSNEFGPNPKKSREGHMHL